MKKLSYIRNIFFITCIGTIIALNNELALSKTIDNVKAKNICCSLGLNVLDTTVAFSEPDGGHVPISIVFDYAFTSRFQIHSSNIFRFPLRGGYVYTPTIGLRIYSDKFYGFGVFLGSEIGCAFTNVPWIHRGLMFNTYIGARYTTSLGFYGEGGLGGGLEILYNTTRFHYFLNFGYIL